MSSKYDRKDHHYLEAKALGVRSRAYFKLKEIDEKFQIISPGMKVIDLGAWPGGWIEYTYEKMGARGFIVGVDIAEIDPFPHENIALLQGDLTDENTIQQAFDLNNGKYDLVLSDMSPKFNGIKESDYARAAAVGELAIYIAIKLLKTGANLIIKVFKSADTDQLINENRKYFQKLVRVQLKSTRKTSNEFYLVGFGFKDIIK